MTRLLILALLTAACATNDVVAPPPSSPEPASAWAVFEADLAQCKEKYGYDGDSVGAIGENKIAPNELETRVCVYQAIRNKVIPISAIGPKYEALIATDQELTKGIQSGTVTRAQRRTEIERQLGEIEALEAAQTEHSQRLQQMQEDLRRTEFTRGMVRMMR